VVLPKIAAAGIGAGIAVLGIGIMAGFAELFSAVFQGSVCASGIALLPKTKGENIDSFYDARRVCGTHRSPRPGVYHHGAQHIEANVRG